MDEFSLSYNQTQFFLPLTCFEEQVQQCAKRQTKAVWPQWFSPLYFFPIFTAESGEPLVFWCLRRRPNKTQWAPVEGNTERKEEKPWECNHEWKQNKYEIQKISKWKSERQRLWHHRGDDFPEAEPAENYFWIGRRIFLPFSFPSISNSTVNSRLSRFGVYDLMWCIHHDNGKK